MNNTSNKSPTAAAKVEFKAVANDMTEVLEASRVAAGKSKPAAEKKAVAEISTNPYHKIMFDPVMDLGDKCKAMATALVYNKEDTEVQNEERLKAFIAFSEWLQVKRKELAIEMLRLNDAEAFAQLKEVIDELGNGILDFNKKISPFMAILDSLYKMQTSGIKTSDMLKEIVDDREALDALNKNLDEQTEALETADKAIRSYNDSIAELKTKTSWYSLGTKIKPSAQAEINKIELRVVEEQARIATLTETVIATQAEINAPRVTQFEGLGDVKDNLKLLLDITSDTHRQKQKELNTAAADFVESSEKRVGEVLKNIEQMNGRIDKASKNSSKVLGLYAVMNDAVQNAMGSNHEVLVTLDAPEVAEALVVRMQREEKREGSLKHIKILSGIKEDTVKMYDGLSREKVELAGMLDANGQQISNTRYLHGSGIANMGMQLNAMINALGSAANGQSTKIAQELVNEMGSNAIMIRGKESLRAAIAFTATNETLERTIQLAAQSAELMRNASVITGEALEQQQGLLAKVQQGAEDMQRAVTEGLEVFANKTDKTVVSDNTTLLNNSSLSGFNLD